MNIKERASYAWGRICSLFRKKQPEIEVKIEEQKGNEPAGKNVQTCVPASDAPVEPIEEVEHDEETVPDFIEDSFEVELSPDDIEVEIYEEAEELTSDISSEKAIPYESEDVTKISHTPEQDTIPSRMTDEYINWMKAQREAADSANNIAPFDPER